MKKIIKHLLFIAMALIILASCKKDKGTSPDELKPNPTVDIPLKEAKIILPVGSNYDLTGHELMTYATAVPVDKNGQTKVADIKGAVNIAYLLDGQNTPIMAGFVTDSTSTISVESTAKVLLYYGLGVAFRQDTITHIFINGIDKEPSLATWVSSFTNQWKANPKLLTTNSYIASLNDALKKIVGESPTIDIYAAHKVNKWASTRTADVQVDQADVRSGLQLAPLSNEFSKIIISNLYRRRAHAFIYKMKHKLRDAKVFTDIIPRIESSTQANRDLIVTGSSGVTSVTGTISAAIQGKGMEFAVSNSEPITFDLAENEDEAVYKVRIVGVGNKASGMMTTAETNKKELLLIETFALDFLMPAISATIGVLGEEQQGNFIKAVDTYVKLQPGIHDKLNEGKYSEALVSTLEALATDAGNIETLLKATLSNKSDVQVKDLASKLAKQIKMIDYILQGSDWLRIGHDIGASKQLEEWEVTARVSKVTLLPKESAIQSFSQQALEAEIRNLDENQANNLRFEWKTSGKYGYLIDTKGNQGSSFESTDKKIFFNANAPASALSDGDNWEYIYVRAYDGDKLVGSDSAKVNVKKSAYKLSPQNATLTGRQRGSNKNVTATSVKLYIKPINSKILSLGESSDREYKVVWTTDGKYGGFGDGSLRTVTTYGDEGLTYTCTDDQTIAGTETVTTRIYSRAKGDPNANFELFDELRGTIKIDNDPKKIIIWVPIIMFQGCKSQPWSNNQTLYTCYKADGVTFAEEPDAERYTLQFEIANLVIGAPQSHAWKAGDPSPYFPEGYQGSPSTGYTGGQYSVMYSWTSRSSYDGSEPPHKFYASGAWVTIWLK